MGAPKRQKLLLDEEAATRYWPEEVIEEILVRLPVQSILKFKSTCKNWYSLIRSRSFIEFHRAHHLHDDDRRDELFFSRNHGERIVYTTTDEPYNISCLKYSSSSCLERQSRKLFDLAKLKQALTGERVDLPFAKTPGGESGIHVLGPLNNGICCVIAQEFVKNTKSLETYGFCKAAFCNLGTREFEILSDPFPFINTGRGYRDGCGLLLDLKHVYGFGSIQNNGVVVDYKVVAIEQSDNLSFRAAVYSLQRRCWSLICDSDNPWRFSSPSVLSGLVDEHGVLQVPDITQDLRCFPVQALLNGSCHWTCQLSDRKPHCILQFEMTNEVFGLMQGPPDDEYYHLHLHGYSEDSGVFDLDGHLAAALITVDQHQSVDHIDLWMLMEYGVETSWTKIFSCDIKLQQLCLTRFLGLSFSKADNGVNVERVFFENDMRDLMSCDRRGAKKHRGFKHHWACWKPLGLSPYVETLEPVPLQM